VSFLSRSPDIEEWLDEAAEEWSGLTDREYRDFWRRWRETFEGRLATGRHRVKNIEAMAAIERRLPFEGVIFSAPGYEHQLSPASLTAPVYAYRARLTRLDCEALNANDAIVAESGLAFTCLYTHEISSLADPVFLERA
jgi:hypothetical protein